MRATAIIELVRRLLAYETTNNQNRTSLIEGAEHVSNKLCLHLSKRIGQEGFRTLLARALTLTASQFPYLNSVQVGADGCLAGLREAADNGPPEDLLEGAVALFAQLLGLLITFIGEDLTLRIISAVWPELAWDTVTGGETETL